MKFSRQGYWSGSPFPSPGGLPNPGIEPGSPALQADSLPTELQGKPKVKAKSLSLVRLFATPWTVAHHAPPYMGFSRQEYWSASPFPSPGGLPDPGIKPRSPALQSDSLLTEVQFHSVAQSCPTLFDPMDYSTPGFPVHHRPLELTQTHVSSHDDPMNSLKRSYKGSPIKP